MIGPRSSTFAAAIAAIDDANAGDPNTIVVGGVERPKELAHAEIVSDWVLRLDPDASEAQLLAARAHHLRRWSVPRADYPDGRKGYLQWRTALKRQHAAEVGEILTAVGYDQATIDRVQAIVQKQGLGTDPEVQTHEDALCLVFLATQFDDLAGRLGDEHTIEVLAKTLTKMSAEGKEAALTLDLSDDERRLLGEALARD
jgi:hypothetical protein